MTNARIVKNDEKGATVESTATDKDRAPIDAYAVIDHRVRHGTILSGQYKATGRDRPLWKASSTERVYEVTFERAAGEGKEGGNG